MPARGNLNYDGVTPVAKPGIFRVEIVFPELLLHQRLRFRNR
jgi:hypothetical protein